MNTCQPTMAILPLKNREEMMNRWLFHRLNTLLPNLMMKHKLDMWIVIGREYNEDPVLKSLYPSAIDSSRRLTILVFYLDYKQILHRFVIHQNPSFESFYERVWNPTVFHEDQWECLQRIVIEKKPNNIAVNSSKNYAAADGLGHSLFKKLKELLAEDGEKLVSSEGLVVDWLSMRSEKELISYPSIAKLALQIAKQALSREVIHPGITTTEDVVDWIRQKVLDLGLETSFYPTVDVQRKGSTVDRLEGVEILPGDIVHLDFGIRYLGLATDTQQLAYVLRAGESEPPEGLRLAFDTALRLEDIIFENLKPSKTGNTVFLQSMEQAKLEDIQAMIYSHPVGVHCHELGALIGLYDQQRSIPIKGDLLIQENTCYAMEFNIRQYVQEWNQEVPLYLEEPIAILNGRAQYMADRQTSFYLI